MVINTCLNLLTIYNFGRRYLRSKRADIKSIKRNRSEFYVEAWEYAAAMTGSTIESLGSGIFKITKGERSVLVCEQNTQLGDSVTDQLISNKAAIYRLLAKSGVPLPQYIHLKDLDISTAKSFMSKINRSIVVKPAYGTGAGAGITTNVTGVIRLYQALAWSRAFCLETVIEEQIKGDNYRLLVLNGELLDCIIRRPPTVIGDGITSIRRLIQRENKERIRNSARLAQNLIYIDLDTKNTLAAQGMSLRTKPAKGQVVKVKDVINFNRAEDNESPAEGPAESLILLSRKISETIGVSLVGIDIITEDFTKDLGESGGRVIEVNTPPGHFYHHHKKGEGYPVGVRLLQQALE